jgi:hypothetical protein
MISTPAVDTSRRGRTLPGMTPRRSRLACSASLLVALSLAAACDKGETPIGGFDDECDPTVADDDGPLLDVAAPADEPIAIDCSFSFDGVTETVRYEADVEYEARAVGGDLNVSATLFDDELEGRSFSISLYDDAGTVGSTVLYQFSSTPPVNEFAGQHGFTGLNWVRDPASGENVQYACFARHPDDPIEGWDE